MKNIKNKKSLLALLIIAVVTVSGTLAYFSNSAEIDNVFDTGSLAGEITETFTSPGNWKPGDTTTKTAIIENTGTVPAKVRVKFDEEWQDANGNAVPLVSDGELAAVINLDNTSHWAKSGEYYYYDTTLDPEDTALSPIASVTFNNDVEVAATVCTNINTVRSCTTTAGFNGHTYLLTIRAELAQAEAYLATWGITAQEIATPTSYIVRYDPNGGTVGTFKEVVTNGDTYSLPTATKTGYTLEGWYTDAAFTSGNKVQTGDTINLSADTILFAHWVEE